MPPSGGNGIRARGDGSGTAIRAGFVSPVATASVWRGARGATAPSAVLCEPIDDGGMTRSAASVNAAQRPHKRVTRNPSTQ